MFCQLKRHVFPGSICIFLTADILVTVPCMLETRISIGNYFVVMLLDCFLSSCSSGSTRKCTRTAFGQVCTTHLINPSHCICTTDVVNVTIKPLWLFATSLLAPVLQPCFRGRGLGRWQAQVWVSVTWWRSWELRWLWQRAGICGQNLLTRMVHRLSSLGRQLLIPLAWLRLQIWCIGL